jgi:hypothetical protein
MRLGLAVAIALVPLTASAGKHDLVLSRLGEVNGNDVVPQNQAFRSLASELGVVIAPKFLSPSDTLGFSGFQFSGEYGFTQISGDEPFWCATREGTACGGAGGKGGGISTLSVMARKGLWFPLPSFELGAGATKVLDSKLWAAQFYAKFAVHEGFHEWPIPSVAVRGAVSRMFGSSELDLTVASVDLSISKEVGVGGSAQLSPYGGWNVLWIVARSEVIDKTPMVDSFEIPGDVNMNFAFAEQDNIFRQRFFAGLKLKYYIFAFTVEGAFALAGASSDDRSGTDVDCSDVGVEQQGSCDATDLAGSQMSFAGSFSFDF